jgi:hypothetical protein
MKKRLFLTAILPAVLTMAARPSGAVQQHIPEKGLEGTWRVQVTIVDCATGAPGVQFASLLSFAVGGTATDTTANQALPGERTTGLGAWHREPPGTYIASTEAFILFGTGIRPWIQRIDQRITMTSADRFTSAASVTFSQTSGTLPGPLPPSDPGCATARGFRI